MFKFFRRSPPSSNGRPQFVERVCPYLDREATIAGPDYNRWLVPPAAVFTLVSVGQVYSFSVFNKPLSIELGVPVAHVVIAYQLALVMLGLSAAAFGNWANRSGPRKTMMLACVLFSGGLLIAAEGVRIRQLALVVFGYGFVGGVGLGLGYISASATLVKWFPDKPGMATGVAIVGFGGGALFGSPLSQDLMAFFIDPAYSLTGATYALLGLAILYASFIMLGAVMIRVPAADWVPKGYTKPPPLLASAMPRDPESVSVSSTPSTKCVKVTGFLTIPPTKENVSVEVAWRRKQFWLLWFVLLFNVSAGIGVLGRAADMCEDMFGVSPVAGAGFVGLLSVFNMLGRFLWYSASERLGRKPAFCIYFMLGFMLFLLLPSIQEGQNKPAFAVCACIIISLYGGGFSTIPAYIKDLFGTHHVVAIHDLVVTSWSIAAVIGPSAINAMFARATSQGQPHERGYNDSFYLISGLLVLGFLSNLLVSSVDPKYGSQANHDPTGPNTDDFAGGPSRDSGPHHVISEEDGEVAVSPVDWGARVMLCIIWIMVATPLSWAAVRTIQKCIPLFE